MKLNSKLLLIVFALLIAITPAAATTCDFNSNGILIDDNTLTSGNFEEARYSVTNQGSDTRTVSIELRTDGKLDTVQQTTLSPGQTKEFDSSISAGNDRDRDGTININLRISANCGYEQTFLETMSVTYGDSPVASFETMPETIVAGEPFEFRSTSTDPQNDITSLRWNLGDGTTRTGTQFSHIYQESGYQEIILRARDSEGNRDVFSGTVRVNSDSSDDDGGNDNDDGNDNGDDDNDNNGDGDDDYNQEPRAYLAISPDSTDRSRTKFDATGSYDPDGTIENYRIDFDNDGVYDESSTTGIFYNRFDTSGTRTVRLGVEDNEGKTGTTVRSFSIGNDRNACDITSGLLKLDDRAIEEGESSQASVNVYNNGEAQEVRVTFKLNGVTVSETTKTVTKNQASKFSTSVSPDENSQVKVSVDLIGNPCGDQQLYESSRTLFVSAQQEPAGLKVIAVDTDGNRIEDARITINEDLRLDFTDSDGESDFTLRPGAYKIEGSKDRYTDATKHIVLSRGEARTVRLVMADRDQDSSLTVRAEDEDGQPINNAKVTVQNGERQIKYTDSDGETGFSVEPDNYEITVEKSGYEIQQRNTEINPGQSKREVFELRESDRSPDDGDAVLEVCVRDEDYDNVRDVRIQVENGDSQSSYTGSDGCTGFNLEPDEYDITASKSGFTTSTRIINLDSGDDRRLNMRIQRTESDRADLHVNVEDEDGDEIRNARVEIENGIREVKRTDNDGETSFRNIEADRYDIEVSKTGYITETDSVRLSDGETETVTVTLRERDTESDRADLYVNVEDEDEHELRDARVEIENGDRIVRRTDNDGEADFRNIEPDRYDIEVSKTGYITETDSVRLSEGETETVTVTLRERDNDEEDARLRVLVEDEFGDELRDARVRVRNGDFRTDYTDNDGESIFYLEPDRYDVTVTKSGYRAEERSVRLSSNERETLRFTLDETDGGQRSFDVEQVSFTSTVCRGDDLDLNVRIENGDRAQNIAVGVRGLGDETTDRRYLSRGETRDFDLTLQNVEGSGSEQIRIAVINGREHVENRNVRVLDCSNDDGQDNVQQPDGITLDLAERVQVGDSYRVSGYVDGVRGPTQVRIFVEGEKRATVSTEPDGFYQTYLQAENVGSNTVEARSGDQSASKEIDVRPTVSVTSMESPEKVFENDRLEICANVESQVTPLVVLERDGEKVESKNQNGNVCFDIEAEEVGEHEYRIEASARGAQSSKIRTIETLELDNEVENFPDKVAMVRSDGGIIRASIYNIHDETRKYDLELSGLRTDWMASTDKSVYVSPGERKNVYFYMTPEAEGEFRPLLEVSSDRDGEIYSQEIIVNSGGTKKSRKPWFRRLRHLLRLN